MRVGGNNKTVLGGDGGGNEVELEKWEKMRDTHH